jgi:WD40 repeat protein
MYLTVHSLAALAVITMGQAAQGAGHAAEGQKNTARLDHYGDPLPPAAAGRLGSTRFLLPDTVRSLAFSRDGKTLASASHHLVVLWDCKTGKAIRQFQVEKFEVRAVTFTDEGKVLVVGGAKVSGWPETKTKDTDTAAHLLEPETGRESRPFAGNSLQVLCGAFAADGKAVATGSQEVCIWDRATGKELRRLEGHPMGTGAIAFSPDASMLVSTFFVFVEPVRLWDTRTGKMVRELDRSSTDDRCVTFSPNGKILATGGQRIRFWDVATGRELRRFGNEAQMIHCLAFSPDGATVVSGEDNGRIRLWGVATGEEIEPRSAGGEGAVAFAPDGKTVFTAGGDGVIRAWDHPDGRPLRKFTVGQAVRYPPPFTADGKTLAVAKEGDGIRLWNVSNGKEVCHVPIPQCAEWVLALSVDGNSLVGASYDGKAVRSSIWDVPSRKERLQLGGDLSGLISCAFNPEGTILAVGGMSGSAGLMDAANGKVLGRLSRSQAAGGYCFATRVRFSPDGKLLAVGYRDGIVSLFEVATRAEIQGIIRPPEEEEQHQCWAVAFSADGRLLAAADRDNDVRVLDVATGAERARFKGHHGRVLSLAFAPDGKTLVSGSVDTTALIWEVSAATRAGRAANRALGREELETLWGDLAGDDAAKAHRAVWTLATSPRQSVSFLRERLRPVPAADPPRLPQLVADLDSEQFDVREKAARELEAVGNAAESLLKKAVQEQRSPELKRRAKLLLDRLQGPLPAESLRALRALSALEHSQSEEARLLLGELAKGAPQARLTQEAKGVLARWGTHAAAP